MVLVQKYGGSSVADVSKIGHVADRIVAAKRAGSDVVVVVSAMGKTTDELIALARLAAHAAHTGDLPAEPPRRELDMLVSTGERVSMALLSIAIQARGEAAISFTGSQSGILTDDRHFDARIVEVRPHRIQEELARGKIVIVAGYQGMSKNREITTLGRGGTDTTAVALAAALGASRCEIYSDVDGVYSADPRTVENPRHWPEIDVGVLAEMAEAGAKVINAQAVEWARRSGITLVARRTTDPVEGGGRETTSRDFGAASEKARHVRSIVGLRNVILIRARPGSLDRFLALAASLEVPVADVVWAGQEAAWVHIPLWNVPDWARCERDLSSALGGDLEVNGTHGVVSVVGFGLTGSGAPLAKVLETMETVGVKPRVLLATPLRISATVGDDELARSERALHSAFVE